MAQIRYLGYIIDKDGRHPDPEKIEVIRQIPVPKNVAEVRPFLRMINYYVAATTATLRELRMLSARFGNPRRFCDMQGIEHVRSPPFHPQSNGQVERVVDTSKRTLQKIKEGGHEKWIPARVKNRYGRSRVRRANGRGQFVEKKRYPGAWRKAPETIAHVKDNSKNRRPTIAPPTTTRSARQRRPPRRLQPDPKMKTYAMRSS
ncbi:hypothetical protein RB195_018385 [Necator americanus]